MVQSGPTNEELSKIHQQICHRLHLDSNVVASSWDTFESISKKFVLEGEKIHWLGCAIYVACRESHDLSTASTAKGTVLNFTSLLTYCKLRFVQFFSNISRWADMAQLPEDFRNHIENLRSNYSIVFNTFDKLHPLFVELFVPPELTSSDLEASKQRNKKNKPIPCTSLKIFEFIWNLFITLKSEELSCGTDLIKSHHLLYCCIDFVFKNVVSSKMKEFLNDTLIEELTQYNQDFRAIREVPCMVQRFCQCDSVIKKALHMKAYIFRQLLNKLIEDGTLLVDETDFTGVFDNFDQNFRNLTKAYESNLQNHGQFDERVFLNEFKRNMMERDQSDHSWALINSLPPADSAVLESPVVPERNNQPRVLDTPLTGRSFLGPRDSDGRSVAERVSRLHAYLRNRKAGPSDQLKAIFDSCQRDPQPKINEVISKMKVSFTEAYTGNIVSIDEAQNRFELGVILFYRYVEMILNHEKTIRNNISGLVENQMFYQCMLPCCLEIVLYCYNFPKKFPWILDALNVEPVHFVKVIELIVRLKETMFRELVKHLNRIEETVIESLAWTSNSPIWEAIEKSGQEIPKFQDTALPGHLLYDDVSNESLLRSPGTPSAVDRFHSPLSQLCRSIFPSSGSGSLQQRQGTHLVVPDQDGTMKLIPIMTNQVKIDNQNGSPGTRSSPQTNTPPRRTGSLAIIFRKFYNLAGIRLQHLCSNLGLEDIQVRRKIWTIFEDSIRHTDLIKDRHLDQLLMCAIYVICKVGSIMKIPDLFTVIMRYYRLQPQACSSVYRDVLIERAKVVDGIMVPEEREDLIHFYNSVYIKVMESSAIKFQPRANANDIILSPLPASRKHFNSSNTHQIMENVIVKPLEGSMVSPSSGTSLNYYFSRSPSKELMQINRAINGSAIQGKRLLVDENEGMPNKRITTNRKLQSLVEDRQRHNATNE